MKRITTKPPQLTPQRVTTPATPNRPPSANRAHAAGRRPRAAQALGTLEQVDSVASQPSRPAVGAEAGAGKARRIEYIPLLSGGAYDGQTIAGRPNGLGTYHLPSGEVAEGFFLGGKLALEGGTVTLTDGSLISAADYKQQRGLKGNDRPQNQPPFVLLIPEFDGSSHAEADRPQKPRPIEHEAVKAKSQEVKPPKPAKMPRIVWRPDHGRYPKRYTPAAPNTPILLSEQHLYSSERADDAARLINSMRGGNYERFAKFPYSWRDNEDIIRAAISEGGTWVLQHAGANHSWDPEIIGFAKNVDRVRALRSFLQDLVSK